MSDTFIKDMLFVIAFTLGYLAAGYITGLTADRIDFIVFILFVSLFRLSKIYDLLKQRQCCKKD